MELGTPSPEEKDPWKWPRWQTSGNPRWRFPESPARRRRAVSSAAVLGERVNYGGTMRRRDLEPQIAQKNNRAVN